MTPQNDPTFPEALDNIREGGVDKFKDLQVDSVALSVDWAKDREYMDKVELDVFGEHLVNAIHAEAEKIHEGMNEEDRDYERERGHLLRATEGAMTSAIGRVSIIMQNFEGSDISNEVEVVEFWQRAAGVIQSIDARALMYESAEDLGDDGELIIGFYESIDEEIPEDYTAVIERILTNEYNSQDIEFISDAIRTLSARDLEDIHTESTKIIQSGQVALLLRNLNENQDAKYDVMEDVINKPGGAEAILNLTVGGYLTISEAEGLIEDALAHEADPGRREALTTVLEFLLGDTMNQVAEERNEVQREVAQRMPSLMIGHKNQALAKLSYKGIGATYLKLIATTGIVMNVLANIKNPIDGILLNPMIAASLAIGTAGAALDPSDIGLWPKPGKFTSHLLKDRDDLEDAEVESRYHYFKQDMLNHPIEGELYYNLSDRIDNEARAQRAAGTSVNDLSISFEDIGIDYSNLSDRYKSIPKEKIEERLTDWAQTFLYEEGLNLSSAEQQKRYMNEARQSSPMLTEEWPIENFNYANL